MQSSGKRKDFANPFCRFIIIPVGNKWVILMVLLFVTLNIGAKVTPLGQEPDWSKLDPFQNLWSLESFRSELKNIYCPRESWWKPWIKFKPEQVLIRKKAGKEDWYILQCLPISKGEEKDQNLSVPLEIKTIALDPGHIGGDYAEMEGRSFRIGEDDFVKEGDLSLKVAKRVKDLLEEKGFKAILVRSNLKPVTKRKPQAFEALVETWIKERDFTSLPVEEIEILKRKRREMLFYRVSEIHARAKLINEHIQPDLTVCLHLNAAPWGDENKKELVDRNDYHVLVNGCYMGGELAFDDQRFEMIFRLLSAWQKTEQIFAEKVSITFGRKTGLPAFAYKGPNALKVGNTPGVWARNLLANRIYQCPVVFMEPYIANSKTEYERIQLGPYEGTKNFGLLPRLSLVEEYAQCLLEGILAATGK